MARIAVAALPGIIPGILAILFSTGVL